MVTYAKQHPEFITVTCLDWKPLLEEDSMKDIIIESLRFLARKERIIVYGFVIMINHFHMIWQMKGDYKREEVQRDFLKYLSRQILTIQLLVNAKDRKYQVWERNSLGIPLWSTNAIWGKLNYMHANPVKAGLCAHEKDYKYSSAKFYANQCNEWDFLVHIDGR